MELRGRWGLVTGAARRIGRSIALALAGRGLNVIVHYNASADAAAATVREIEALGVRGLAIGGDLARGEDVARLAREAEARSGGVDVLVNNASNYLRAPFDDLTEAVWDASLDVNLKAPFLLAWHLGRAMRARARGRLVNPRRRAGPRLSGGCGLGWERAEQRLLARFLAALRARHGRRVAPLARLDLPVASLGGLGAVHCARHRIPALALGVLADNPFPDATPAFLADLGRLATRALGTRIRIRAPFRHLGKATVIRHGRDLPLALTLSCARPRDLRHCGRCTKCAERQHAFAAAGVPDPTRYVR